MKEVKKILVVKLGPLGDFVLALAAMKRIRAAHPKARITLLTAPPFEALAKASPYFNTVLTDGQPAGLGAWWALARRIKRERFDRIYDLQNSPRSSLYFQMMRPFAPAWSGTARGCALPHRNPARDRMHVLERQAEQLKDAGIWPDAPTEPGAAPPPDLSWILKRAPEQRPVAGASKPRPYVMMTPGAGAGQARWPEQNFGELAALLRARGFDIVIIGGPHESALARHIQKYVGQARDLTGRTDYAQIAVLAAKAALAVGNDTGPMHLIAAAGAPTIVLCGKDSQPELNGPRGHVALLRTEALADLPVSLAAQTAMSLAPNPR